MSYYLRLATFTLLIALGTGGSLAAQPTSRYDEIEQMRREKAQRLSPPEQGRLESFLLGMERTNYVERWTTNGTGLTGDLGGLPTSQGFTVGAEYETDDLYGGQLVLETSARVSVAKAYQVDVRATAPKLAGGRVQLDLFSLYGNYPRFQYYGKGPDTDEGSRTVYRLEQTSFDGEFRYRLSRNASLGATGGYVLYNVGPGTRRTVTSTDQVFTSETAPGLHAQTNFMRLGGLFEFDYRDLPGGTTRSGGFYSARYTYYDDQVTKLSTFRLLQIELQQYVPFFNGKRVIALRGMSEMTWSGIGQFVPFYLLPRLGGSHELRGFPSYRFQDENSMVASAEYRWESFAGLDMALFFDAGKVVPRRTLMNFADLETSAGFGFRFNVKNELFMRIDVGFSNEGAQLWLKFSDVF